MDQWLERHRGVLLLVAVLIVVIGLVLFRTMQPVQNPIILPSPTPVSTPEATPTPPPLQVYVSGAVSRPDVYVLPPGSIVKNAIVAAA